MTTITRGFSFRVGPTAVGAISDLSLSALTNALSLTYTPPGIATSYEYRIRNHDGSTVWTAPASLISNTISSLTSGVSYDVQIRGIYNNNGLQVNGDWSNTGTGAPTSASSSLVFNITYAANWTTNPNYVQANAVIEQVRQDLQSWFNFNCSIGFQLEWGTLRGSGLPPGAGSANATFFNNTDYDSVRTLLLNQATDGVKSQFWPTLPAAGNGNNPSPYSTWAISDGHYAMLTNGTSTVNNSQLGGPLNTIGFGTTQPFTYNLDGSSSSGHIAFYGHFLHEWTEMAMGRVCFSESIDQLGGAQDLARWKALNTRSFVRSDTAYFSLDAGATNAGGTGCYYNTDSSTDMGGWGGTFVSPFNEYSVQDANGNSGKPTQGDMKLLAVLGPALTAAGATYAGV